MTLNPEQEIICSVFSRRDDAQSVHCASCPIVLSKRHAVCLKAVTEEEAYNNWDWSGSPYPALGDYKGEQDEQ